MRNGYYEKFQRKTSSSYDDIGRVICSLHTIIIITMPFRYWTNIIIGVPVLKILNSK